jgi:hypothetical protein
METTPREATTIRLTEPKPLDARFVQMVSEYLDRIHNRITTNSEPRHIRLLPPRRPLISNTQAQVIGTAVFAGDHPQPVLPRWIHDSVVIWSRELIELEELSTRSLHVKEATTSPVHPFGERNRDLPHQFFSRGHRKNTKSN